MVICLEQSTSDLHMVQMMSMPTPSSLASLKSRTIFLSGAGLLRLSWKRGH